MSPSKKNSLSTGRPRINLDLLVKKRSHPDKGVNECVCITLVEPRTDSHSALVAGLRRILPFLYRSLDDMVELLKKYGVDIGPNLPLPDNFDYQWASTGEFLMCAYFEECENASILSYKWRLNTRRKQHPFGMDLLAFDLTSNPPTIYAVAVKTTSEGGTGKAPTAIYNAVTELSKYFAEEKLDDDLGVIFANLHTDDETRRIFEEWYDPYTQKVPSSKPKLIAVPAIVIDERNWNDRYAMHAMNYDFGVPGAVRVLCIHELESLVNETFIGLV